MAVRATRVSLALLTGCWLCAATPAAGDPRFEVLFTELNGMPIAATPVLSNLLVGDDFRAELRLTADAQRIVFYSVSLDWDRLPLRADPGVRIDNPTFFPAEGDNWGPLIEGPGFSYSYGGANTLGPPFLEDGESVAVAEFDFEAVGGTDGLPTLIEVDFFNEGVDALVVFEGELAVSEIEFVPGSVSVLPEPVVALSGACALATLLGITRKGRARPTGC